MRRLPRLVLAGTLAALALASAAGADHNTVQIVSTGPAAGNGASAAAYKFISQDGNRVVFQTNESLVAADTDTRIDLYERVGSTTNLVSIGPAGGNSGINATFVGASDDGARIFFHTTEKLVAVDTDTQNDVYERAAGTTSLLSLGPTGGSFSIPAFYDGNSDNGSHVFFHTAEKLVAADTDSSTDVYDRSAGTTARVSSGSAGGNGANAAFFDGASGDGTRVFFSTDEGLEAGDTDAFFDVYERSGGTTTRLSTGPGGGNGAGDAFFDGNSTDGTRVFFSTDESLESADTDSSYDVYESSGGGISRVSRGPLTGNGANDAFFSGASTDGARVFFETDEILLANDADNFVDVYERAGATLARMSTGPAGGNGGFDADFAGASADGSHVYFETEEILHSSDVDSFFDLYDRSGGATTLVSLGPAGGNGNFEAHFEAAGSSNRVFFNTDESLVSTDTDTAADVYERSVSGISRASGGLTGGNGAANASFAGISADGSFLAFTTTEQLVETDTDSSLDVYVASTSPPFARPASATPFRVPLVPAYSLCSSPNSTHVAPLSTPACTPPAEQSSQLTTSTIGRGSGFARLRTIVGDSSTPANEADVRIDAFVTDVLSRSNGLDYTGQTMLQVGLRITDRGSGSFQTTPATVEDTTFAVPLPCTAHAGAAGSSCEVDATVNSLVPGYVKEGALAVISVTSTRLLDAGADNSLTPPSGSCPPTCGSGDEATFLEQGVITP
jgi:hypothetical protein